MPIYFNPFSANVPLTLESFGNQWLQDPVHRANEFPFYSWIYTESGCGEIKINNQKYSLRAGHSILIPPHTPHSYSKSESTWVTAFATFTGTLASAIEMIIGQSSYVFSAPEYSFYFKEWIDKMVERFLKQQLSNAIISTECYNFLLHFADVYSIEQYDSHPLFLQYVAPIIEQIETYYNSTLTLEELAKTVFISPQYLNRLFLRFTNLSVYSYIINYRINKAKELLVSSVHLNVMQIQALVGFVNSSHFIATFKKHTGQTPLQFRQMYSGQDSHSVELNRVTKRN